MVRLKSAYIIRCDEVIKDQAGNIIQLNCSYLPESKSGNDTSGINVKGTLHWVSVATALPIEIRLYDRLFSEENVAAAEGDFKDYINKESLNVIATAYAEPALAAATLEERYQFIRKGYFCLDKESTKEKLVFNRTVTLKDTWAKTNK
jgi:glutaminyl-tRNA synthetase